MVDRLIDPATRYKRVLILAISKKSLSLNVPCQADMKKAKHKVFINDSMVRFTWLEKSHGGAVC